MPARIAIKHGEIRTLGGVPYTLITTRENLAFLAVATEDADGFIDEDADIRAAAKRWKRELDGKARSDPT